MRNQVKWEVFCRFVSTSMLTIWFLNSKNAFKKPFLIAHFHLYSRSYSADNRKPLFFCGAATKQKKKKTIANNIQNLVDLKHPWAHVDYKVTRAFNFNPSVKDQVRHMPATLSIITNPDRTESEGEKSEVKDNGQPKQDRHIKIKLVGFIAHLITLDCGEVAIKCGAHNDVNQEHSAIF